MLTENDVVNYVCEYLLNNNYQIEQKLTTSQTGVDIIAQKKNGQKIYVEAKGATSSKKSSSRFGKEFNSSQVKSHVGVALVATFKLKHQYQNAEVVIALPGNETHKNLIFSMKEPLLKSGVSIFFVNESGTVEKYI
ncbi:MAG: restriction endonuclease [Paraglaciecola chathamensis]|uniref:restriction endonuclease n=1 Tax=Neptunomonas phycophila TaxID=1572645 RepID=UPI0030F97163